MYNLLNKKEIYKYVIMRKIYFKKKLEVLNI